MGGRGTGRRGRGASSGSRARGRAGGNLNRKQGALSPRRRRGRSAPPPGPRTPPGTSASPTLQGPPPQALELCVHTTSQALRLCVHTNSEEWNQVSSSSHNKADSMINSISAILSEETRRRRTEDAKGVDVGLAGDGVVPESLGRSVRGRSQVVPNGRAALGAICPPAQPYDVFRV